MIYKAVEVIWIFSAGRTGGRTGIEGSIRGPRGPKNALLGFEQPLRLCDDFSGCRSVQNTVKHTLWAGHNILVLKLWPLVLRSAVK